MDPQFHLHGPGGFGSCPLSVPCKGPKTTGAAPVAPVGKEPGTRATSFAPPVHVSWGEGTTAPGAAKSVRRNDGIRLFR